MLDIKVYPACLDCKCPKIEPSWSTASFIDIGNVENQHIKCIHHRVCKRIDGQKRIEIVRCRDCVSWDEPNDKGSATCHLFSDPEDGLYFPTPSEGFCAWGERGD